MGDVADFNARYGITLDPRKRIGWSGIREIRAEFLLDVLTRKDLRDAITSQVVCIRGAWFRKPVFLLGVVLKGYLCIERSRFDSSLHLLAAKVTTGISLDGSKVSGELNLHSLIAGGSLTMAGGEYSDISVSEATMGALYLSGSTVTGRIDGSSVAVRSNLYLNDTDITEIMLNGAQVGDVLNLQHANIRGPLRLQRLQAGALLMRERSHFNEVDLSGAQIQNNVELTDSIVSGPLLMDRADISGNIVMVNGMFSELVLRGATIRGYANLDGAKVKGPVNMQTIKLGSGLLMRNKAHFKAVDLFRASIGSNLELTNSTISGTLEIGVADIGGNLWIDDGRFSDIDLVGATIRGFAIVEGSTVKGSINMRSITLGGNLLMGTKASFKAVDLFRANIGGNLGLANATVDKSLVIRQANIAGNILMDNGLFSDIDLYGAKIRGYCSLQKATVKGQINMESIKVNGHLLMRSNERLGSVDLYRATIRNNLELVGSKLDGDLRMIGIKVGGDLWMNNATFRKVDLDNGTVDGTVSLRGSNVSGWLDMRSVKVGGDITLDEPAQFADVYLFGARIGRDLNLTKSVAKELNMLGVDIGQDLRMDGGTFGTVTLTDSRIASDLSFNGAKVGGPLRMDTLQVAGYVSMNEKGRFKHVELGNAKIGQSLSIRSSTVTEPIDMYGLSVGESLYMDERSEFESVSLSNAKIGNSVFLNSATVSGILDIEKGHIGKDLQLYDGHFSDLYLIEAYIGGNLDLEESEISKNFDASRAHIVGHVILRNASILESAFFHSSQVDIAIDAFGTVLKILDMRRAKISQELTLGGGRAKPARWVRGGSRLVLRDASVRVFQVTHDSLPIAIDLDGFKYDRIVVDSGVGALSASDKGNGATSYLPNIDVLKTLLGKGEGWSPEPYQQLAVVLRNAGFSNEANDVLYESKERERSGAAGWWWLWLTILDLSIGYGYGLRYFRSLGWIASLMVLGAFVLWVTGERNRYPDKLGWGFAYSLDMLLPFELDRRHGEIELSQWATRYFYVQKAMGYVLASFIIAGLAGVTKY